MGDRPDTLTNAPSQDAGNIVLLEEQILEPQLC